MLPTISPYCEIMVRLGPELGRGSYRGSHGALLSGLMRQGKQEQACVAEYFSSITQGALRGPDRCS